MKGNYQNRLIHEKSPYLLQHADNPVDWYPWGEEAFAKARKEDKPVFLSIGYSTCHWCHVMEHESFEDPQIAKIINDYFVPIKVDREERPDIDSIYMAVVMAMTGRGGWPLTVVLTPDKKPFFGGTYFPAHAKWGSPGLIDVMQSIHEAWQTNRAELVQSSITFTEMLKERVEQEKGKAQLNEAIFTVGFEQLEQMYDQTFGGFGHAPKFPSSHNLSFLLRYWHRQNDPKALKMVEHTLVQMANGGMYDHIAGGFHRYSTDRQWQIPHFEKMLYDQAILAKTYLEVYQITHKPFYAQIAREIFDYVIRDMQHPQGGFFSAEDADSLDPDEYAQMSVDSNPSGEKKEGAFYLWRYEEMMSVLGQEDGGIFNFHFGVKPNGNALADPHGEFIGKNIVYVKSSVENTAKHFGKTVPEIQAIIQRSKEKLFDVRKGRPRPHLDDKILTDWNGLMISSLAFGSRILREPRYQEAAERSAQFILQHLVNKKGRLLHRYRDGEAAILGTIEDYAFFIHGLLDLYEATFHTEYLKQALHFAEDMLRLFWDPAEGGFYFTAQDAEELLFRQREIYDGAIPSGNSLAALDLVRLYHLSFQKRWEEKLDGLFDAFSLKIRATPSAYAQMLIALDFAIGPSQEIVLASANEDVGLDVMLGEIYGRFLPNKVVLLRAVSGKDANDIVAIAPFVDNQRPVNGKLTVYVCENHVCKFPVHEVAKLREILDGLKPVR